MSAKVIGLVAHTGKPGAESLVTTLMEAFTSQQAVVRLENRTAALIRAPGDGTTADLGRICDLLVVLGGDGTILQVVHEIGDRITPLLGINLGSLGFLTCVNSAAYADAVNGVLSSNYVLSHRTLLHVEVERDGRTIAKRKGLNDAVISRGELSRLVKLQTRVNGAVLTEYNADGLIVSTPTGSTAYSLSAGGPILTPDSGVFVITPICPHVLTNRSVIFSDRSMIEVTPAEGEKHIFLTVDGQELVRIHGGDTIRIWKADQSLPLVMLPQISFFELLRQKLKWSGSAL